MDLLNKKKVLITGGTSGIGKAIALLFVKNGADVAIFGTNKERAEQTVSELESSKIDPEQKVYYSLVDVSSTSQTEKAILDLIQEFDGIDILINNAGITKDTFLIKMTEEDWDMVLNVNLKSIFNTSKVVARYMMKAKSGKIINISSIIGIIGATAQANYSASKAGMIGFTKSLAKELSRKNICVNCIAPGFIQTKMTDVLSDDIKQKMLSMIPLGRYGDPKDVANAALFLASNMSDYITGQVITVDGGMVM